MSGRRARQLIVIVWLVGMALFNLVLWRTGVFGNANPMEWLIIASVFILVIAGAIWGKGG